MASSMSECTCPLFTFVFEFELCTSRAPQETGGIKLLRLQNAILVRSNYIPHTFNIMCPELNPVHSSVLSTACESEMLFSALTLGAMGEQFMRPEPTEATNM